MNRARKTATAATRAMAAVMPHFQSTGLRRRGLGARYSLPYGLMRVSTSQWPDAHAHRASPLTLQRGGARRNNVARVVARTAETAAE